MSQLADQISILAIEKSYGWDYKIYTNADLALSDKENAERVFKHVTLTAYRKVADIEEPCPYSQSHTQDWCGYPQCRES